ncbi:hypothetical protein [Kytococcus sp. Marseille-QA3725]
MFTPGGQTGSWLSLHQGATGTSVYQDALAVTVPGAVTGHPNYQQLHFSPIGYAVA